MIVRNVQPKSVVLKLIQNFVLMVIALRRVIHAQQLRDAQAVVQLNAVLVIVGRRSRIAQLKRRVQQVIITVVKMEAVFLIKNLVRTMLKTVVVVLMKSNVVIIVALKV
jgi:hypothetical protein